MSEALAALPNNRRSQAERRASTRARLLDATLQTLTERGYARTTTLLIEDRAGVSRGARLHHFPTKAKLMSAAVERLYEGLGERYQRGLEEVSPEADRFREGLRLLWQSYLDPMQAAVLELDLAARHDADLRAQLQQLTGRLHQIVRRHANAYFPNLARRDANGLLEMLQATMRGLALRRSVHGESPSEERVLDLLEELVKHRFDSPGQSERRNGDPHE